LECNEKQILRINHIDIDAVKLTLRFVSFKSKNPSSTGVRHVSNSTILKALKTCYFSCFLMLDFNQKQMKS